MMLVVGAGRVALVVISLTLISAQTYLCQSSGKIARSDKPSASEENASSRKLSNRFQVMNELYAGAKAESGKQQSIATKSTVASSCTLGDEIHEVGDRWNPDLPPHGIQVCVLCECIASDQRRNETLIGSEPKVTCRRIAKDCPKISSCPFGERPIAPPGQCCKSCQSHNILGEGPVTSEQPLRAPSVASQLSTDQLAKPNKTLVEFAGSASNMTIRPASISKSGSSFRSSSKELNTKDSKLAFKSLETQSELASSSFSSSAASSTSEFGHNQTEGEPSNESPSICKLGNDTYSIGDSWNPDLPPFGIQVCVRCECVARLRKSCYEAKVTCRRVASECPIIESCPGGEEPVTAAGHCCKSCLSSVVTSSVTIVGDFKTVQAGTNISTTKRNTTAADALTLDHAGVSPIKTAAVESNSNPSKEPPSSIKGLPLCKRDGSDFRISKRSRGSTNTKRLQKSKKNYKKGKKVTHL